MRGRRQHRHRKYRVQQHLQEPLTVFLRPSRLQNYHNQQQGNAVLYFVRRKTQKILHICVSTNTQNGCGDVFKKSTLFFMKLPSQQSNIDKVSPRWKCFVLSNRICEESVKLVFISEIVILEILEICQPNSLIFDTTRFEAMLCFPKSIFKTFRNFLLVHVLLLLLN